MRVALFSPLPPSRSGIADYSEALVAALRERAEVEAFTGRPAAFDPAAFDALLYQIGNNPHHAFAYEMALAFPGVVALHEANLHHLLAEITIKRGDWDAYLAEVAYDGGLEALAYAGRVRALEVGPDYEGVPMLRRLVERSRAFVVHSGAMEEELRRAGFRGPVAVIPHGAWLPDEAGRMGYRQRLGLDESTPLIGVFGFLKPYKRIAESLRAFRRLVRVEPRARLVLVGEPHPDFPVHALIRRLNLEAHVRVLGFVGIDDFTGYMAACDVVLNLRFPTVGESSGSLLRALGLGRAVVVSGVGSFRELPDGIVLKAPVDASEEDFLYEYLNLLVSRPEMARALGARARDWVERECNWGLVAARYLSFLDAVARGAEWERPEPAPPPAAPPPVPPVEPELVETWAQDSGARVYLRDHLSRLTRTLEITPPGSAQDRILEMGSYLQITPALKTRLGYGEVRGCYYGPAGRVERREVVSAEGERFTCEVDLFDAERDRFPYPDAHFRTVLCCELIEHLADDPMHMLAEINRVLAPGGHLVLTTPNIASLRALRAILEGFHPGFFPAYVRPRKEGEEAEARHNREYTPKEIAHLLTDSGFEIVRLETGPFAGQACPEHAWVTHLLERYLLPTDLRGDGIYAVGRKTGPVRERYPAWLYQ
ncbi:MAG: methyltransferase domain-containing protein [Acidobacteria bacterium]|nr:methyltransferase domain-containing protein [Acidobacteriota bacterium]